VTAGDPRLSLSTVDDRELRDPLPGPKPGMRLDGNIRILYAASFLVDLGLCLYFFMFSLFLVEHHFTEHAIGFITAALTIGTMVGTVPAGLMARRFGLRAMMLTYLFTAPVCLAARALFLQLPVQIGLAFLAGAALSVWSVCFSPTLAKLTTRENRTLGFSVFIVTGIASGALAGLIGGYLPGLFDHPAPGAPHVDGIKIVLLLACAIVSLASLALFRLRLDGAVQTGERAFGGFLVRFLVAMAVWNFSVGFFTPFANVYLSRQLGLPLSRIGLIFTVSQFVQIASVLMAPLLYRRVGLVVGIAITQIGTALMLWGLSLASGTSSAVGVYVLLTGLQWMGIAGISSLLMNHIPDRYRSQSAAMYNLVNLAAQASSAALAGKVFEDFGYAKPLAANAAVAALAAILLYALLGRAKQPGEMPLGTSHASREAI
jgi:MFS family permease